ncbi:MAG: hypothetical protein ABI130_02790 [Leifsonia sp.]
MMIEEPSSHPHDEVVDSDPEVLDLVSQVVGSACREKLWGLFLGPDLKPARLIIPIEDLPPRPDRQLVESSAHALAEILRMLGGGSVILVRERPGPPGIEPIDAEWAHAFRSAFAIKHAPLRAIVLSHDSGVRMFPSVFQGPAT